MHSIFHYVFFFTSQHSIYIKKDTTSNIDWVICSSWWWGPDPIKMRASSSSAKIWNLPQVSGVDLSAACTWAFFLHCRASQQWGESGRRRAASDEPPEPPHHRPSERFKWGVRRRPQTDARRSPTDHQLAFFSHTPRSQSDIMKTPALLTFIWPHWRSVVAVVAPLALMPLPIISPTSVSTIFFFLSIFGSLKLLGFKTTNGFFFLNLCTLFLHTNFNKKVLKAKQEQKDWNAYWYKINSN